MKTLWTSAQVEMATKGDLLGNKKWESSGPSMDTRTLVPGEFYIAIRGESLDGHAFVADAFSRGAVAALVDHIPEGLANDAPLVLVSNTDEALLNLGSYARERLRGQVIGITGSAGKTSTKDMLKLCLSDQGETHASGKSFNNKWGVPFTLAQCDPDSKYVILEMGMSHGGELSQLTQVARPHVAIITTIAPAHIENFDSIEGIARAKAEIFEGVDKKGVALINGDIPQTDLLVHLAEKQKIQTILLFGEKPPCKVRLLTYKPTEKATEITAEILGEKISYTLQTYGKHFALNSLAVLAAVKTLGANLEHAATSLSRFEASDRRGKSYHLKNNIILVDESYNANPLSMRAALQSFVERPTSGRKIVVLGDMRELGPDSSKFHQDLENPVLEGNFDKVYTFGTEMKALHSKIVSIHCDAMEDLIQNILKDINPNDAIMIKASNSINLNKLVNCILDKFKD
jgi:UDP-N-acetylmuramoyl-tripeptide--D-alanyl-D-alanine ligase